MSNSTTSAAACTRARELDLAAFALDRAASEWAEFRAHYPRCVECSRAVASFAALAVVLEGEAAPASAHPEVRELLAYADARPAVSSAERARITQHLAHCAACRSELGVLQRFDVRALEAERSGASARAWLRSALARLEGAFRLPLRAPAFAFAAAAAIAAVALWISRESEPVGQPESAPSLAGAPPTAAPAPRTDALPEPVADAPDAAPTPSHAPPIALAPDPPLEAPETEVARRDVARAPTESAPAPGAAAASEPLSEPRIASQIPAEPPRYEPGALARGPLVRIGGVGRGAAQENAPPPLALAPPHASLTSRESPTLYWFLPAPTSLPIAVTLSTETDATPLLDLTLAGPHAAGVHSLALAERGVRLAPGIDYTWFVAVVRDPERRSRDLVAGAAIRFAPAEVVPASADAAADARAAHLYAEAGYWYDAFDQLSRWSAAEPDSARLRRHRAALLEQVGLAAVAENALSAAPPSVSDP